MIKDICAIGHPGNLGGADSELSHQIKCWQKMGIKVHLVPTILDSNCNTKNGCTYHTKLDWKSLKGMHCISFCNSIFLKNIGEIKKYARTSSFVNCMTWNFPDEIAAASRGNIDFHLYQSDHQMTMVGRKLKVYPDYRPLRFKPYFHQQDFPYTADRNNEKFQFGRISRGDAQKFAHYQVKIYEDFESELKKSAIILGWDRRGKTKIYGKTPTFQKRPEKTIRQRRHTRVRSYQYKRSQGDLPTWIKGIKEKGITQQDFYKFADVMIQASDTFENLPRVGFEAMSSGSILVVDDRGGWRVQVEDGKTGFLCKDQKQFTERSTWIANHPDQRDEMRQAAKDKLEQDWGIEESMKSWELVFKEWEKLK